jgi:hypothetical protein
MAYTAKENLFKNGLIIGIASFQRKTSLSKVFQLKYNEFTSTGDVAERLNAPVSKTGIPQGIGGSNPPISALNIPVTKPLYCSSNLI